MGRSAKLRICPLGWTAFQEGGTFRLEPRQDQAFFGFAVGQQSWKQFLLPPHQTLWQAHREGAVSASSPRPARSPNSPLWGSGPVNWQAMAVQDRVFLQGAHVDPTYRARREQAFIVALNCGHQDKGTCFCVSMGTGPRAATGFDLALTEVLRGEEHFFVVEIGTDAGGRDHPGRCPRERPPNRRLTPRPGWWRPSPGIWAGRWIPPGSKTLLYANYEHPRWDEVAARCLNCGNCTMVCPTCFCHTLEDSTDLTGAAAERRRRLDSCFTVDFSYLHGGSIRTSPKSRYRQWLTHKLATWIDQFGVRVAWAAGAASPGAPWASTSPRKSGPSGRRPQELRRSNTMETMEPILAAHPFFKGLDPRYLKLILECASRETFTPGQFLCRDNEEARKFYVIHHGRVAVEIYRARRGPVTIQTLGEGEVLGWLWFDKPYHWHLDARALDLTRVISLDVQCLMNNATRTMISAMSSCGATPITWRCSSG